MRLAAIRCLGITGLLLLGAGCLVAGCSSFSSEWKQAAAREIAPGDLQGRWLGRWLSESNGHNGGLKCIITIQTNGLYRARFHATYKSVLTFGYTVPLQVENRDGSFEFKGEANLGWAGGIYHYAGKASGTNFFSTYRCESDHGTFQMSRP